MKKLFKVGRVGKGWWKPVRWWVTHSLAAFAAALQTCCGLWIELSVPTWVSLQESPAQWLCFGHALRSSSWILELGRRTGGAVGGSFSSLAHAFRRFKILQILHLSFLKLSNEVYWVNFLCQRHENSSLRNTQPFWPFLSLSHVFYISTWKADIHHSRRFATTIHDLCRFGKQQIKLICPTVSENRAKLTD